MKIVFSILLWGIIILVGVGIVLLGVIAGTVGINDILQAVRIGHFTILNTLELMGILLVMYWFIK